MSEPTKPPLKSVLQRRFKLENLNLFWALAIAVFAAGIIVAIAYSMYLQNPNRKYDLARPGKQDSQSLRVEDGEADTTSPVTPAAARQKIDYLKKEIEALNEVSRFEADDLNDRNIQLVPSDQPSF